VPALEEINRLATHSRHRHDGTVCKTGMSVAGMRIIPLCMREDALAGLERIAERGRPVISVAP